MLEQFGNVVEKIKKIQQNMDELNEKLQTAKIEVASSDVVKIVVNGQQEVVSVEINAKYLSPDNAPLLQDLILNTVNNALSKSRQIHQTAMEQLAEELNLPKIPGLF